MRNNRRKNKTLLLTTLLFIITIGFAALAANLKIDGVVNVAKTSWNVHFENVDITSGSVTATTVPVVDDVNKNTTEITYAVNLTKPGDFYEFTVDMVNSGTIDAMIDSLVNGLFEVDGETTKTLPSYLESSIKYNDDIDIARYHYLKANTTEKIKVRVSFRTDINPGDLPSTSSESMKLILKADFKQADNNAIDRPLPPTYDMGDVVNYDPVNDTKCTTGENCLRWRVITSNDTTTNKTVSLQLDHNIVNKMAWVTSEDYNDASNYGSNGNVNKGPITILKRLETETANWSDSLKLNYTYDTSAAENNYGVLSCSNGVCTIKNETVTNSLKARIITGEEMRDLTVKAGAGSGTNAANWNIAGSRSYSWYNFSKRDRIIGTQSASNNGDTSLYWLLENTIVNTNSGATSGSANGYSDNEGYWMLTPGADYTYYAWFVSYNGNIYSETVRTYNSYGIRPVIDILKTKLI